MEYVPIIAATIAAVGAAITVATFWINRGKAEARIEQAVSAATVVSAKTELVASQLAEFKQQVAREYVTINAIDKVEQRVTTELHRLSEEFSRRFDALTQTLIDIAASGAGTAITK